MLIRSTSAMSAVLVAAALLPMQGTAAVIFSTGFESSEGYALGQLAGQNGWYNNARPVVQNSSVFDGSQAVSLAAGFDGQGIAGYTLNYSPESIVTVGVVFRYDTLTNSPTWSVMSWANGPVFLGGVILQNGNARLGLASSTVGSIAVTPGQWTSFLLVLDFQNQTQSAYVNGAFLGSGAFAGQSTVVGEVRFGQNVGSATRVGTASWDNLSVNSVPEPTSGALILLGGAAAFLHLRRTRRARQE